MKSRTELLAIVQGKLPKLDIPRMRDIVEQMELENQGDIYSRINMQLTAKHWGLTVAEMYYLIDPIRA